MRPRAPPGGGERPPREHADQMAAIVGRGVQVGLRLGGRAHRLDHGVADAHDRGACRPARLRPRRHAAASARRPSWRCAPARSRRPASVSVAADRREREIAAAARDLLEPPAGAAAASFGNAISVTISSSARSTVSASEEEVARRDRARARRRRRCAARHRAAAPSSAARRPDRHATGCRRWCRGCGSPDARHASSRSASTGKCRAITGEVSS